MGTAFWGRGTKGYEGPDYAPNPHDTIVLGGKQLPGVCKVKALPTQEYGREKTPGRDGAAIILQGYLPGPIDIECLMWTPSQWVIFQDILASVWVRPGKLSSGFRERGVVNFTKFDKAGRQAKTIREGADLAEQRAIDIGHPALQALNITRVVVTGLSVPEVGPFPQSRVVNIKCLEFVPAPKNPQTKVVKGAEKLETPTHTLAPATVNNATTTNSPGNDKGVATPKGNVPKGRQGTDGK
jgi:hypothetical protein